MRFLNSVGGGRVVRIEGAIAYVDEDGFETPVLVRECVVVGGGDAAAAKSEVAPKENAPAPARKEKPRSGAAAPAPQLPGGDAITLCLGFEPLEPKALSTSGFDASLVNDSNYTLYVSVATRASSDRDWTLRFAGTVESGMQEYAFTLTQQELVHFDRVAVQALAFKEGMAYELRAPLSNETKVDNTRFAKLHCFRPHRYFETPALVLEILHRGEVPAVPELEPLRKATSKPAMSVPGPKKSKPSHTADGPVVVDLHASELLDSTAGLSPADILNYQVDTFCRAMDTYLRRPGTRIVFIHGKGEGVLRQAIMKELTHRYKGHDVQDASFAEYGFGATQVTVKNLRR